MGINNNTLDFNLELAKGLVPKHVGINKFGSNLDIDTAAGETIWSGGGLYIFPSSADTLRIISNDNDDSEDSTGAHLIKVQGLDANYDIIEEYFVLRGQAPVNGEKEFLRVHRAFVVKAGSSGYNEGVIIINNSDDSSTLAIMPAEEGQTQMAIYTVPRNHKAYLTNLSGAIVKGAGAATSADIHYYSRDKNGVRRLHQQISLDSTGTSEFNKTYPIPLSFEEETDLYAQAFVGANNTSVFVDFGVIVVDQSAKYQ